MFITDTGFTTGGSKSLSLRPVRFPFIPKSCQPDSYPSIGCRRSAVRVKPENWRSAVRVKPESWQADRLSAPGEQRGKVRH